MIWDDICERFATELNEQCLVRGQILSKPPSVHPQSNDILLDQRNCDSQSKDLDQSRQV